MTEVTEEAEADEVRRRQLRSRSLAIIGVLAGLLVAGFLVALAADDGTPASQTGTSVAPVTTQTQPRLPTTASVGNATSAVGTTPPTMPPPAASAVTDSTTTPATTTPAAVTTAPAITTTTAVGTDRRVPQGTWGGRGIQLVVGPSGGSVEYDCATGFITEALVASGDGRFEASGTHAAQRGGPVQPGTSAPSGQPARYSGSTDGTQMQLTVTLPQTGTTLGPFVLALGQPALLDRCG